MKKAWGGYNDGLLRRHTIAMTVIFVILVVLLGIVNTDDLDGRLDPGYRRADTTVVR